MNERFTYLTNALIYPATNDWKSSLYTYGIDTEETSIGHFKFGRSLIDIDNRASLRNSVTPKRLNGTYLYLGAACSHFGHFFSECISRYWALDPDIKFEQYIDGIIILPSSGELGKKYAELTLRILGLSRQNIVYVTELSIVDHIIVPEQGCITGCKPQNYYIDFLNKRSNPNLFKRSNYPEKLFVSRRNYKNFGRLAGMDYVCIELQKKGYFEFTPENYSIPQQLEFICSAKEIIWEEGSSIHLLEILPYLNSNQILLMRRELTNFDYIKFVIEHKCQNLITYSNVSFINSSAAPHNRMSRLNDNIEFSKFIETHTGALLDNLTLNYESILDQIDFSLFESSRNNPEPFDKYNELISLTARSFYPYKKSIIIRNDNLPSRGPKPIIAWCIDYPPKGTSDAISYKNIEIRGWFVLDHSQPILFSDISLKIVSLNGVVYEIMLDIARPDVVKAVLAHAEKSDELTKCGFSTTVSYDDEYYIYLCRGGELILLSTIKNIHTPS